MEEWVNISISWFNKYVDSFKGLTSSQLSNIEIKKDHSLRVANISLFLAEKLELSETIINRKSGTTGWRCKMFLCEEKTSTRNKTGLFPVIHLTENQ